MQCNVMLCNVMYITCNVDMLSVGPNEREVSMNPERQVQSSSPLIRCNVVNVNSIERALTGQTNLRLT